MILKISGEYSCRDTPVPIPNTEVKSATSMILGWQRPGKVDIASLNKKAPVKYQGFFYALLFFIKEILHIILIDNENIKKGNLVNLMLL